MSPHRFRKVRREARASSVHATFREFFETWPVKGHSSLRKIRDERGVLVYTDHAVADVRQTSAVGNPTQPAPTTPTSDSSGEVVLLCHITVKKPVRRPTNEGPAPYPFARPHGVSVADCAVFLVGTVGAPCCPTWCSAY